MCPFGGCAKRCARHLYAVAAVAGLARRTGKKGGTDERGTRRRSVSEEAIDISTGCYAGIIGIINIIGIAGNKLNDL